MRTDSPRARSMDAIIAVPGADCRVTFALCQTSRIRTAALNGPLSRRVRSEEHTSELQSLMRISYAVFCLKKKKTTKITDMSITTNFSIEIDDYNHNTNIAQ